MKNKINKHLDLFQVLTLQIERRAESGTYTRDEAFDEFQNLKKIFAERIFLDFREVGKELMKKFEIEE